MIRKVISSIGSRLLVMFLTLGVVVMITQTLGDEGQGKAALIQLGILLIVSVTNFIAGGAVVYLTPRMAPRDLVLPAYAWSIIVSGGFFLFFLATGWVPEGFELDTALLGMFQALFTFHLQIVLGREKVHQFNLIVTLQAFVLAMAVFLWFIVAKQAGMHAYVNALYASFVFTWLISFTLSLPLLRTKGVDGFKNSFRALWRYGRYAQSGNILQLLNYRLNFIIVERLISVGATGLYSLSFYASEAIWNVGKSLSLVQGARIVNSEDAHYNRKLTLTFLHISMIGTALLIACMLAVPDSVYQWIFGEEMAGLRSLLLFIAPGIFANACSVIFAHHFSGVGKHSRNTIGSGAGLIGLLICVFPLINAFGVEGAAMAASIGYSAQCTVMLILFLRLEKIRFKEVLVFSATLQLLRQKTIKGDG